MNDQEEFWAHRYAQEYKLKNSSFDQHLGVECWQQMLRKAEGISSILECGSNIGRNIEFLDVVLPDAKKSIVELSEPAYEFVTSNYNLDKSFNGSILNSDFPSGIFDLTFKVGVPIHIDLVNSVENMSKLFDYSGKYILIAEYFNRTPVAIDYQGESNKLLKRDFGRLFMENFPVSLVDHGFLWGHLYDDAGFDDITWWLFQKSAFQEAP